MKITRLYSDVNGKSRFETIELPLFEANVGKITEPQATSKIIFGEVNSELEQDWHHTPCRQYIIMLQGNMEIEISGGAKQIFNVGDILLVEDLTGQGHKTRSKSTGMCKYVAIPLL